MLFPMHMAKKETKNLAIINLQPTPLDTLAKIRIWGKIDDIME